MHEETDDNAKLRARPQSDFDVYEQEMHALVSKEACVITWDDVSGNPLGVAVVLTARRLELDYFEKMGYTLACPEPTSSVQAGDALGRGGGT